MSSISFSNGVEPGGLRTSSEIKVLICYLLDSLQDSLSKQDVIDVLCENGLANYFDIITAFSELEEQKCIKSSNVDKIDGGIYSLEKDGKIIAEHLTSDLPYSVKQKALNAVMKVKTTASISSETLVEFKKIDDGYMVECSLMTKNQPDEKLMTLSLRVPDLIQAEFVKKRFLKDPSAFYRAVNAILIGEPTIVKQLLKQLD